MQLGPMAQADTICVQIKTNLNILGTIYRTSRLEQNKQRNESYIYSKSLLVASGTCMIYNQENTIESIENLKRNPYK